MTRATSHVELAAPRLPVTSRRRGLLELGAALASGAVKVVGETFALAPGYLLVGILVLAWSTYGLARVWRDPRRRFAAWGLGRANLRPAARACAWVTLVGVGLIALVALAWHGSLVWHPTLPLFALLYPAWGLAQQFVLQAIVAANLMHIRTLARRPWLLTLVAASLFGLSHLPRLELVAATFVLGLVTVPIYLRWRNLWPIAVMHGLLGTAMFYWILRQQPLARFTEAGVF